MSCEEVETNSCFYTAGQKTRDVHITQLFKYFFSCIKATCLHLLMDICGGVRSGSLSLDEQRVDRIGVYIDILFFHNDG